MYNDFTIVRLPNGYLVKTEAFGEAFDYVDTLDGAKRLMHNAKNEGRFFI